MAIPPKLFQQMSTLVANSLNAGHYGVRLAQDQQEVQAAQHLRYEVLFKESGGSANPEMLNSELEEDEWDAIAYHVVVVDKKQADKVVGTIRLVSSTQLDESQPFYTEHAFNLDAVRAKYPKSLELSRACVSPEGRGGAILMLLWKFTMQFIEQNAYQVLFGCASFKGQDYSQHQDILAYLYEHHLASPELMPIVKDNVNSVSIKRVVRERDESQSTGKVPTLLKGYLKVGARVSDRAVIDPVFNTTFVAIYVITADMFSSNHSLVKHSF
ncbi:MAG: GNAT family N-acyltransferase [Arenicella sp.]|jgi:putative hemolysin|nr:GNAT family N-acyltransferase [Arenicella sp.]